MLQLLPSLSPGELLKSICDSPEVFLAFVQRNVKHDELLLLLRQRLIDLKLSSLEPSETLFGSDSVLISLLQKRFSLLREKTAEGSAGLVFKTDEGHAWAFSPVDAMFSIADLLCSPSDYLLGWLLLLQLPVVKIYNVAAYERILRRLYAMFAADTSLHAAALKEHISGACVFAPHNFTALRMFLPQRLESYYPFFTTSNGRVLVVNTAAEYIKTCWVRRELFKPETSTSPSFSDLVRSQLFCIIPSAYLIDSSLSADLNFMFYVNASTGEITRSLSNLDSKSLELFTTWAVRSNSADATLGYDTSVSDLLYDSLSIEDIKKRYTVVAQLVDYAVKTSLQRDVYFAAHIRYSLSGFFYVGSLSSVKAAKALYKSVSGWEEKPVNFPFAASLRSTVLSDFHKDSSGSYTLDAAGYWHKFESDDEYLSVMTRWLFVVDVTAFISYGAIDYTVMLPSMDLDKLYNRKIPSITYLEYDVWPKCASGSLGPLPQPYLTAPMTKRTTPVYSIAYVASLATSIGQYLQIIESICFGQGGYYQGDLVHGQPVFMTRCLGAQLLSEIGVGAPTIFHTTSESTHLKLLMNIPRFLKYLAHDGHISPLAAGFSDVMRNRELHTGPVSPRQFYSWYPHGATDHLTNYKIRLRIIDAVILDRVYNPAEFKSNTRIPDNTPNAIRTIFTREERNDVWRLGEYDEWNICWYLPKVHSICRSAFSSRVDGKKLTFPLRKSPDALPPIKDTPVLRPSRSRVSYFITDVHEVLPGGYTMHARVLRKGFQTLVSLPWDELFTRYRIRPPHFTVVYHHKLSQRKKQLLMDPRKRKEQHWGLYVDFCYRITQYKAPPLKDLIEDWGIPLADEQAQLVHGVRVYKDVGFVFDLDFLLNLQSNSWDGGKALCDMLPYMKQLIEKWRVLSFSTVKYEERQQAQKVYNASRRKTARIRNKFTPEEDLTIINYYRKDMPERARAHITALCADHDWLAIAARANKLAIKLVKEQGIMEEFKLPVVRVGKALRKLIDEVKAKQISGELPC
jgi:hypothetical protein